MREPLERLHAVVTAHSGEAASRLDLLVHALAQVPHLTVEIAVSECRHDGLDLLARAYDVRDRLTLLRSTERDNAATLRPRALSVSLVQGDGSKLRLCIGEQDQGGDSDTLTTMAEFVEALWSIQGAARLPQFRASDGTLAGHRVAVITHIPARYRLPLLAGVRIRCEAAGCSFRVFFTQNAPAARPWMAAPVEAFDHVFLRNVPIPIGERHRSLPQNLESELRRFGPTIIVAGGFSPLVAGRALAYATRARVPFGVLSGEIGSTPTAQSRPRRLARQMLMGRTSFGIAYGSLSREYLRGLAPDVPAVYLRNTSVADVLPDKPSITEGPMELLTVSHLVPRKRVDLVISAVRSRPKLECRLTIVGDGPLRRELSEQARGDARIRFAGALSGGDLAAAFQRADAFVFPSAQDVFGLVLVEAMAAGLPSVVSRVPGAVADLCVDAKNSLVVDSHDVQQWLHAIERLVQERTSAQTLGTAARRTVAQRWTINHSVNAFVSGLRLGAAASARL